MKSLSFDTLVNAGEEKLNLIASSIENAKIKLLLGFLLKKLGEKMIERATPEVAESFVHGHVKATYVKESSKLKPDFSADEKHIELLQKIAAYEKKMADKMPQKETTTKAHYRFTITG